MASSFWSKVFTTKRMAIMAVMAALASVLYIFVKFPLPIFPSFLDIQISELPAIITGFLLGPVEGIIVILIKELIKLPMTSTAGVGELADLLIGISYVLPASLIYRKKHNIKGALIGLSVGYISSVIMAVAANYFILIPFYVKTIPGGWDTLVKMLKGLYADITRENFFKYYLLYAIIPFNLLRGFVSAALTFVLYKQLSRAVKHLFRENATQKAAAQPQDVNEIPQVVQEPIQEAAEK